MARINIKDISIKSKPISETDNVRIILCPFNYGDVDFQKITTELEKKATVFNYTFQDTQRNLVNIVVNFESVLDIHIFKKSQSSNDNVYNYLDTCTINNKNSIKNGYKNSKERDFTIKFDIENSDDEIPYVKGYKIQIKRIMVQKITAAFHIVFVGLIPDEKPDKVRIFYKEGIIPYFEHVIEFTGKDNILIKFDKKIIVSLGIIQLNFGHIDEGERTFIPTGPSSGYFKLRGKKAVYDIEYEISEIFHEEKVQRKEFSWELSNHEKLNLNSFSKKINKAKDKLTEIYKGIKPQETAQPRPDSKISSQLNTDINPLNSEENNRINQFITEYYQEFLSNPDYQDKYIKELTHSQYPVMAYPVYPEPAYYYLKQISERFILPASGSMPDNSIALFVNNPAFVEAFLCGMNTEMGRELLWREYPTDSRGSYFRKFWDTEIKKDIKEELRSDTFFDILPIHKWDYQEGDAGYMPLKTHKLGQNHTAGKDNLLIFAIKGELLKKYPETIIYLSKASLNGNIILINPDAVKILPDLSAWLSEDTYIVGFPAKLHELTGNPATRDPGYFLTFMNRPGETRFASRKDNPAKTMNNAAETAANLLVQPSMFGKHISQFLSGWQNAPQK